MSMALKVRLHHLDHITGVADAAAPDSTHEFATTAELEPLLAALAVLSDNGDSEPMIHLQRGSTRWRVRSHRGRLAIDDPTQPLAGFYERTPAEFAAELAPVTPVATEEPGIDPTLVLPPQRWGWAVVLVAGLVAVNAFTFWMFTHDDSPPGPAYEWVDDTAEAAALHRRTAGHFATGGEPGDRVLALDGTGAADWSKLDAKAMPSETQRLALRPAKLDGRPVLVLADKITVAIEVADGDTLRLYGDTYKRVK